MSNTIDQLQKELNPKLRVPNFKAGATITVHYKIREGNKERVQQFQGVVIQRKGSGVTETFTVRKISGNIGVERIFPVASPFIDKIEVNKQGKVRRARIFYFRQRRGKSARFQEQQLTTPFEEFQAAGLAPPEVTEAEDADEAVEVQEEVKEAPVDQLKEEVKAEETTTAEEGTPVEEPKVEDAATEEGPAEEEAKEEEPTEEKKEG